jgi:hypothetical protein
LAIELCVLNTGERWMSQQDDVKLAALGAVKDWLLQIEKGRVPILQLGYDLAGQLYQYQALLAVFVQDKNIPVATIAIHLNTTASGTLWQALHQSYHGRLTLATNPAHPPESAMWGALRFETSKVMAHPQHYHWLIDLQRCLAWSFAELTRTVRPKRSAT